MPSHRALGHITKLITNMECKANINGGGRMSLVNQILVQMMRIDGMDGIHYCTL